MTLADDLSAAADQIDEAASSAGDAFALMAGIGTQTGLVGATKSATVVNQGIDDAVNAALSTQAECASLAAMLRARAAEYQVYLGDYLSWIGQVRAFDEGHLDVQPDAPTIPWWAN